MNLIHHATLAGFGFCVGASVGSFLNVCIWRWPRGESVIRPASRCPRCGSAITARDNVPLLSWLLLRGRCRRCAEPISARYPLIEAAVGLLFALIISAESAFGPHDLLDRDLIAALARVSYHWALGALLVVAAMIEFDRDRNRRVPSDTVDVALRLSESKGLNAATLAAGMISLTACLTGDLVAAMLNLALLTVFLHLSVRQDGRLPNGCKTANSPS